MSKLEDKLKASLKPGARKDLPAKVAAKMPAKPATTVPAVAKPVPAAGRRREPGLNDVAQALHPRRIWPD